MTERILERTAPHRTGHPLRILFVCRELPPARHGGTGTLTLNLANRLASLGHSVTVIAEAIPAGTPELVQPGVRVVRLPAPFWHPWRLGAPVRLLLEFFETALHAWQVRRAVRECCQHGSFDVIEAPSHGGELAFLGGLEGHPVVVTRLHGLLSRNMRTAPTRPLSVVRKLTSWASNSVYWWLERRGLKRSDALVYLTRGYRDFLEELEPHLQALPSAIIGNGIDVPAETNPPPERDRDSIVFAGRVSRDKGVDTLLDAIPTLLETHPNLRCRVFGHVVETDLVARAQTLGLTGSPNAPMQFLGARPNTEILAALQESTLTVFPSRHEAFPLVPLEAMIAGSGLIVSDAPPLPELVDHGRYGLVVPVGDAAALSERISWALSHPEETASTAARAKRHALEQYTTAQVADQTVRFYEQLIAGAVPRYRSANAATPASSING